MTMPSALFILLCSSLLSCKPKEQERWREIAANDGKLWMDRRSLVRTGDTVTAWFRFQTTKDSGGYRLAQMQFTCSRREFRISALSTHDSTGGMSHSTAREGFLPSLIWESVVPQTQGEAMLEATCGR